MDGDVDFLREALRVRIMDAEVSSGAEAERGNGYRSRARCNEL